MQVGSHRSRFPSSKEEIRRLLPTPSPRRIPNPKNILNSTDSPILQIRQPLRNALQSAGHNLLRLRLEPALLKAPRQESTVNIPEILHGVVDVPDVGASQVHALGEAFVLFARQDESDGAVVRVEDLRDVLDGALFGDGVEGVQEFCLVVGCEGGLDPFDDGLVAAAVVDDGVAFGAVEELFDVRLGAARDGDDGVDVGFRGQLQGVATYG